MTIPASTQNPVHSPPHLAERIASWDASPLNQDLDTQGYALIENLLSEEMCADMVRIYEDDTRFRRQVIMSRHGYGQGEYKYFAYPLPELVATLRHALYPVLAETANRWNASLGIDTRYPATHADFLKRCHEAGQCRPTALVLRYGPGEYNCLHQDIYGDCLFPLQLAILLSQPGSDFTGGEFLLVTQRPRRQSWAEVVPLERGTAVIFPVHQRPVPGARGSVRANMRHGVSRIRSGDRHTLGIIFHDAT